MASSIINQFSMRLKAIADGEPWYGSNVKDALDKVSAEMATRRFHDQHNIAEIIKHMIQWKRFAFEKAIGNAEFDIDEKAEFDWERTDKISPTAWSGLKEKYNEVNNDLIDAILNLEKDWLVQDVPGRKYSYSFLFDGVIEHDAYHLGQILFIYKMIHA